MFPAQYQKMRTYKATKETLGIFIGDPKVGRGRKQSKNSIFFVREKLKFLALMLDNTNDLVRIQVIKRESLKKEKPVKCFKARDEKLRCVL